MLNTDTNGTITTVQNINDQNRIAAGWEASEQGDHTQKSQEQLDYEHVENQRNNRHI